jgi:hypothetical protein
MSLIKNVGKVVGKAAWLTIGAPVTVLVSVATGTVAILTGGTVGAISGKGFEEGMDSGAKFHNNLFVDIQKIHEKIMS